jgi:carbonic anhydrase
MKKLPQVFENNKKWAESVKQSDPSFFERLSEGQSPKILWIGCSDSRVPANNVCGLDPGEMFVHRNIANIVAHGDINCLSVVQYAVEVLKIEDIVVCGHYGCGGVRAAVANQSCGLIDNWLQNIKDVYALNKTELNALTHDKEKQLDRLCELNIVQQVENLCRTTIVQDAWQRGETLNVHGWVYNMHDGILHDMDLCISGIDQVSEIFRLKAKV